MLSRWKIEIFHSTYTHRCDTVKGVKCESKFIATVNFTGIPNHSKTGLDLANFIAWEFLLTRNAAQVTKVGEYKLSYIVLKCWYVADFDFFYCRAHNEIEIILYVRTRKRAPFFILKFRLLSLLHRHSTKRFANVTRHTRSQGKSQQTSTENSHAI